MEKTSWEEKLVACLREQRKKITAAESCTGGLVADRIVSVSGASEVFDGSIVCYASHVKETMIHVPAYLIRQYGVVSTQTASAMAEGVCLLMDADLAISTTGWAGPNDGDDGKPAGTVCIGLCKRGQPPCGYEFHFSGDRTAVRQAAAEQAIQMAFESLSQEG